MRTLSIGGNLAATVRPARHGRVIALAGTIDETFEVGRLRDEIHGTVILDLDGVTRVTSYGVREWIRLVSSVDVAYLAYVRCRAAVVAQFNMVPKFAGRGQVISLYLPFLCDCGHEFELLRDLRRDYAALASFVIDPEPCSRCGKRAPLDELPESYLSFVAARPAPAPPLAAELLIDRHDAHGPTFHLHKEVMGNLTALWLSGAIDEQLRFRRILDGVEGEIVIVIDGLTGATTRTFGNLLACANEPGVWMTVARADVDALLALADVQPRRDGVVVSARLPFACTACGQVERMDVDEAARAKLVADRTYGPPCTACGGATRIAISAHVLDGALRVPFGEMPRAVRAYLDERPRGIDGDEIFDPSATLETAVPARAEPAAIIFGTYRLLRSLGAGSRGETFLAREMGPEGPVRMVALKRIHAHLCRDPAFVRAFTTRARTVARLAHPNLVSIHDVGTIDDQGYYAMEYVRGWTLAYLMELTSSLGEHVPVGVGLRLVADVLAGLSAAHDHVDERGRAVPIVHREVSRSSILVAQTGAVKLTDFAVDKAGAASESDPRLDVLGAGTVLREIISERRPDAPRELEPILARALSRDPAQRFASARALQIELEGVAKVRAIPARTSDVETWLGELMGRARASGMLASGGQEGD
jgi:hypothetical protein